MKQEFKKDFSVLTKDPKVAEKLEQNFHFFNLKTDEEKQKIMKRNFHTTMRHVK